jgi:hypothetical protein
VPASLFCPRQLMRYVRTTCRALLIPSPSTLPDPSVCWIVALVVKVRAFDSGRLAIARTPVYRGFGTLSLKVSIYQPSRKRGQWERHTKRANAVALQGKRDFLALQFCWRQLTSADAPRCASSDSHHRPSRCSRDNLCVRQQQQRLRCPFPSPCPSPSVVMLEILLTRGGSNVYMW